MRLVLTLAAAAGATAAPLLAAASAEEMKGRTQGERAYQKCYSCHALEAGRNDLDGPTLHRIVGRPVAAEAGFAYSPAMRRLAAEQPEWTEALLDRFIADPEAVVPGTTMTFTGMRDGQERAALVRFLRRQSAAPPPR